MLSKKEISFYKSEYIEPFFGSGTKLGVKLTISKEEKPLGTCGPLSLLKNKLKEPFLVMNGDVLTKLDFKKLYHYSNNKNPILTVATKEFELPFEFGNVEHDGIYINNIEEKPDIKTEIVAGIYIMTPKIFEYIPTDTYFGVDNLMKKLLEMKIPILRYLVDEYWIDIGRIDDYNKAQEMYERHFNNKN